MSDAIPILKSIDASLKVIAQMLRRALPPEIAPDSDLDGQYGDEVVKSMPRDWKGDSFANCPMSEMPAELLDMLAERYDFFAAKNEASGELTTGGKPKAEFDRRAAARARGWAKRKRAGWKAPERPARAAGGRDLDDAGAATDDDIPF